MAICHKRHLKNIVYFILAENKRLMYLVKVITTLEKNETWILLS